MMFQKRALAICSVFMISFMTPIFAKKEKEPKKDHFPKGALPSARMCNYPKKDEVGSPYLTASFLFWQAKEGGLEYAAKNSGPITTVLNSVHLDTRVITPDFAWKPGFKFEFGYQLPRDGWNTNLRYTYYRGKLTSIKRKVVSNLIPEGDGVVPLQFLRLFDQAFSLPLFQFAFGKWRMHFHNLDAELGRDFFVNKSLKVHLFGGAEATWIYQQYDIDYRDGNEVADTFQYLSSVIRNRSRMGGIGPRAGFQSKWNILDEWNILADGAFSLVYSFFDVRRRQNDLVLNAGNGLGFSYKLREDFSKFSPSVQLRLGTDWGICIGKTNPYFFHLIVAYEMQYWWGQNNMRRFINSQDLGETGGDKGDLQMQGLTATVEWDF